MDTERKWKVDHGLIHILNNYKLNGALALLVKKGLGDAAE